MRDLDGYIGPAPLEDGLARRTHWHPQRIQVWDQPRDGECQCPCNLAHRDTAQAACRPGVPLAAFAEFSYDSRSLFEVPLCAVCSAAQLFRMEQGKPVFVPLSTNRAAERTGMLIAAAFFVGMAWWLFSGSAAFATAIGMAIGAVLMSNRQGQS